MEKKKSLGEMLRERREHLGHGQEYIYTKLNIGQPAYSLIENDKVRFSPKVIEQVKQIPGYENFDRPAENSKDNSTIAGTQSGHRTLASRWKWGRYWLILLVIVVSAVLADPLFQIGVGLYRGFSGKAVLDQDAVTPFAVVYILLYALLIWWIVFRKKW